MKRSALALRLLRPRPRDRTESRYCRPLNPSKPADCGYPRQFGGRAVDGLGTLRGVAGRIGSPADGPGLAAPTGTGGAGLGLSPGRVLGGREPGRPAGREAGGGARPDVQAPVGPATVVGDLRRRARRQPACGRRIGGRGCGRRRRRRLPAPQLGRGGAAVLRRRPARCGRRPHRPLLRRQGGPLHPRPVRRPGPGGGRRLPRDRLPLHARCPRRGHGRSRARVRGR